MAREITRLLLFSALIRAQCRHVTVPTSETPKLKMAPNNIKQEEGVTVDDIRLKNLGESKSVLVHFYY